MEALKWIIIIGIIVFGIFFLYSLYVNISNSISYNKKTRRIIEGVDDRIKTTTVKIEKKTKPNSKLNVFIKFYKEFVFFDRTPRRFFITLSIGYLIFSTILYIVSQNLGISLVLGLSWFVLFYVYYDRKNEKSRKKYVKGFTMALRTITASIEAGNTFEEAVSSIIKKNTINSKIKTEFALLNNNLKSNKSLEEALELFWKRNSMFNEFSMFVTVMQFYSQKGGEGLGKILVELEKTLNEKMDSYSDIDTELGVHKILMNGLIFLYFGVILFVKLFVPEFFQALEDDPLGLIKCALSVICLLFSTMFFKSMVRSAAEG